MSVEEAGVGGRLHRGIANLRTIVFQCGGYGNSWREAIPGYGQDLEKSRKRETETESPFTLRRGKPLHFGWTLGDSFQSWSRAHKPTRGASVKIQWNDCDDA